jgi:hypothetical protein
LYFTCLSRAKYLLVELVCNAPYLGHALENLMRSKSHRRSTGVNGTGIKEPCRANDALFLIELPVLFAETWLWSQALR